MFCTFPEKRLLGVYWRGNFLEKYEKSDGKKYLPLLLVVSLFAPSFLISTTRFLSPLTPSVLLKIIKKIPMLPCSSSSPPVRKMKLHLWLNLLFYYRWQYSCSYNKFTFWSFKPKSGGGVNCLSVRSSNLLCALESDFAAVSTTDCQNKLFWK